MTLHAFAVLATVLSLCAAPALAGDRAAARRQLDQAREMFLTGQFRESLRAVNESIVNDSRFGR